MQFSTLYNVLVTAALQPSRQEFSASDTTENTRFPACPTASPKTLVSPKTFVEVLSWTVSHAVFRALQPACHARPSFSWPTISQAKYDENSLICDPPSLSGNLRLTKYLCWSTRQTRIRCSFSRSPTSLSFRPSIFLAENLLVQIAPTLSVLRYPTTFRTPKTVVERAIQLRFDADFHPLHLPYHGRS